MGSTHPRSVSRWYSNQFDTEARTSLLIASGDPYYVCVRARASGRPCLASRTAADCEEDAACTIADTIRAVPEDVWRL